MKQHHPFLRQMYIGVSQKGYPQDKSSKLMIKQLSIFLYFQREVIRI